MADQTGPSGATIQAREETLSKQHNAARDADRLLVETLAGAHTGVVEGVNRLDGIAAEIDEWVRNQAALAVETPLGAHEFQKFLLAKQREIIAVVSEAQQDDSARRALLESLRPRYSTGA